MKYTKEQYIWILLRFSMAWMLLWAFFDKVFGFGFSTKADQSWLAGHSPTLGFLKSATGPLALFYQKIAGNPIADWLFMVGLLLIGLALLFGIGMKIAGYSGALMMFLMWTSHLPPQQNPFLDEHIIYIFIFIGFTFIKVGQWWGLGKCWKKTSIVQKFSFLE